MKYALNLGKIAGVKIYIHWTFVILIGWMVISGLLNDLPLNAFLWMFGLTLAVFACIVLHELSHAVVARRFTIHTKHIILLPIGGIAQLESIPQQPRQELLIALAGPASNILIAALLLPFADAHLLAQPAPLTAINFANFLSTLMVMNVWLAIFNLIPAFPMDGGRVLRAILSFWIDRQKATAIAAGIGQVFGAAFFMVGFLYNPMLIFIGLIVFLGGQYESAMVSTLSILQSFTIRDVLMREIPVMNSMLTVEQAGKQLLNTQNKNFVVVDGSNPTGTITREEIIQASYQKGKDVMIDAIKNDRLTYVDLSLSLEKAWKMMHDGKTALLLVGSNGHLEGIVDEENLAEFIQLRSGDKLQRKSLTTSTPGFKTDG